MPGKLYEIADQQAKLKSAPSPGYDVVPGNVLKVAFAIIGAVTFTDVSIKKKATWDAVTNLADLDPKLVVITPFIDGFEIAPTTPLTEGGNDTTTANGVPRQRSISFAPVKGMISGMSQTQADALRSIGAKTGNFQQGTQVMMYLLHEGKAIGVKNKTEGIPVFNFFIGDPKKGGLGASDDYDIAMHLEGGWSIGTSTIEAEFAAASLINVKPA